MLLALWRLLFFLLEGLRFNIAQLLNSAPQSFKKKVFYPLKWKCLFFREVAFGGYSSLREFHAFLEFFCFSDFLDYFRCWENCLWEQRSGCFCNMICYILNKARWRIHFFVFSRTQKYVLSFIQPLHT